MAISALTYLTSTLWGTMYFRFAQRLEDVNRHERLATQYSAIILQSLIKNYHSFPGPVPCVPSVSLRLRCTVASSPMAGKILRWPWTLQKRSHGEKRINLDGNFVWNTISKGLRILT
jgi:hypothetical protein